MSQGTFTGDGLRGPDYGIVRGIPEVHTLGEFTGGVINFFLGFAGLIAVICIIAGGFYIITDAGSGNGIDTGRKIITGSIIGLVVIFMSYTFVDTLSNIDVGERGVPQDRQLSETIIFYYNPKSDITRGITGTQHIRSTILNRNSGPVQLDDGGDRASVEFYHDTVVFTCFDLISSRMVTLTSPGQKEGVRCTLNSVEVWFENNL